MVKIPSVPPNSVPSSRQQARAHRLTSRFPVKAYCLFTEVGSLAALRAEMVGWRWGNIRMMGKHMDIQWSSCISWIIFMYIMNHIQKYIPIFAKIALVDHWIAHLKNCHKGWESILSTLRHSHSGSKRMPPYHMYPRVEYTLWLCQNSYWKWWFIVDFPIENGDFP